MLTGTNAAGKVVLRATVPVAGDGSFHYRYTPTSTLTYVASYGGDTNNTAGASVARRLLVAAKLTASAPAGAHRQAQVITGTVSPRLAGKIVTTLVVSIGATVDTLAGWVRFRASRT